MLAIMSDITATWLLKQLSWYLIALIAVFSFSSVKFLEQILASTTAFESLVSDSAVQINDSRTIHRLNWAFRLSCTAVLLTILGTILQVSRLNERWCQVVQRETPLYGQVYFDFNSLLRCEFGR